MRPSSPLSLLLFIRLISATPIPDLNCQAIGVCPDDPTDSLKPRNAYPEETVPTIRTSALKEPSPQALEPVKELVSTPDMDLSSKTISSSDASYVENVVLAMAQDPSKDLVTGYQQDPQGNDSEHTVSWTKVSWTRSREDSELLVVGIVVLFVIALVAWETVGTLDRLRLAFCRYRRQRGPIFLSDDEERVIAHRKNSISNREPPQEKKFCGKEKSHRWSAKPSCCSDDKSKPCTCGERPELSTSALISRCVRGVCEL